RRRAIGNELYDVMCDVIFRTCHARRSLFEALIDAEAINGKHKPVFEDGQRHPISYRRLIQGSQVMGRRLAATTKEGETVGVLLPNAVGSAVTFFALHAFGRIPAMLNFTAGQTAMDAACTAAGIGHIVTSRRFVEAAKLETILAAISTRRQVHYLEDIQERIGVFDKLYGLFAAPRAESAHRRRCRRAGIGPDSPAVVLFTSGSEGLPKAVVLSHANLLSNAYQLAARIDFNPTDLVFNALPMFHAFGLSAGTILPAVSGVKTFLYPSPLHYRIIPELVYDTNATIFFGTDSFLTGYARAANPYDFYSLRYVFAGAERVKAETHRTWMEKFGLRILEGYGATETAPVLSSNTPMHFKAGTVGRLLPGIEHRLEPVPGIDEGGRLFVKGPNVMLGYYFADAPQQLVPPPDGWYDTGDIVELDEADFITIKGRAKRFAKIAGEMVSLSAVEDAAARVWPGVAHAVVALPDARKGEQLVLLTEESDADRAQFLAHARSNGLTELMVPRNVFADTKVPLLGSGKIDMAATKALAEELMGTNGTDDPADEAGESRPDGA
ncbi:MAG TPA: AMP-binding protein, partial [Kiloniellaceae bacterium]|nr:AMP-binding protein [Kiloniellaceae bacterium]